VDAKDANGTAPDDRDGTPGDALLTTDEVAALAAPRASAGFLGCDFALTLRNAGAATVTGVRVSGTVAMDHAPLLTDAPRYANLTRETRTLVATNATAVVPGQSLTLALPSAEPKRECPADKDKAETPDPFLSKCRGLVGPAVDVDLAVATGQGNLPFRSRLWAYNVLVGERLGDLPSSGGVACGTLRLDGQAFTWPALPTACGLRDHAIELSWPLLAAPGHHTGTVEVRNGTGQDAPVSWSAPVAFDVPDLSAPTYVCWEGPQRCG